MPQQKRHLTKSDPSWSCSSTRILAVGLKYVPAPITSLVAHTGLHAICTVTKS